MHASTIKEGTTEMTNLTITDIERASSDERWLGFGYIGERELWLTSDDPECPPQPAEVAVADDYILERANGLGWDYEQLFDWLNSRDGRRFADGAIGSDWAAWTFTVQPGC